MSLRYLHLYIFTWNLCILLDDSHGNYISPIFFGQVMISRGVFVSITRLSMHALLSVIDNRFEPWTPSSRGCPRTMWSGELASSCAYNTTCAEALQLPWMRFNPWVALVSRTVVCFTFKYYRVAKYSNEQLEILMLATPK